VRRTSLVLAATSLAAFTATLDNTVVAVALRAMQKDLGTSVPGLQGIVTAYTVSLAALLLLGGGLVDVVGAKKVLLSGLAVFAGASAGCALAPSTEVLVATRAVQGLGASLLLPGALAVLTTAYDDSAERRRALGTWAAAGGLALVAGPVVGGVLVQAFGWQSVFWVNLPLCALVAAVALTIPATSPAGGRLDRLGALLTCVVLGAGTYAVVLAGRHGLSTEVALALGVTAVAAVALARVERRPDPLLPISILRDRRFRGGALGAFAASLAVFVLMVFVALFLELVQSVSARDAGLVLLPLPLALALVAPFVARGTSVARPVALGLLLSGGALVALGVVLRQTTGHLLLGVLLAVVGAGVGLTTAPVVSAAVESAGAHRAGLAAGTVNVARELGGVVAVAGLGALAVSRLTGRLSAELTSAGVPAAKKPPVLDLLLRGDSDGVRHALLKVGLEPDQLIRLGSTLPDTARANFVSSTQVVLVVAGVVLVLLSGLTARLLRT
jgi:DHA2 family methylenomycin A resistance protein-like MFS transporter